jgi:hypothetical protein
MRSLVHVVETNLLIKSKKIKINKNKMPGKKGVKLIPRNS